MQIIYSTSMVREDIAQFLSLADRATEQQKAEMMAAGTSIVCSVLHAIFIITSARSEL